MRNIFSKLAVALSASLISVSASAYEEVDLKKLQEKAHAEAKKFDGGAEAFQYLHKVATHPRCMNCHGQIVNEVHVPTVGDSLKPHPMNITSKIPELGMDCTGCHQKQNLPGKHMPPGAANNLMPTFLWHMPQESMILSKDMSQQDLCELWTDNVKNKNRGSLDDLVKLRKEFMHHVEADPLIHWTFNPGNGRTPAPGSREKLVGAMDVWISWLEQGHDCSELP